MVPEIVVAGHLCLDVIPELSSNAELEPGALIEAGEASFATGGAVANVGLTLARLGFEPALVAKVGDDPFGEILSSLLRRAPAGAGAEGGVVAGAGAEAGSAPGAGAGGETAAARRPGGTSEAIVRATGETTSYSIVLSRPGFDRTFIHHPGCNHSFSAHDIQVERWLGAKVVHFGYPPLMRSIYRDGGEALAEAFARLREAGVTVSLDMALPDAAGESGRVDWKGFLEKVLPHVDLFLPSWDETAAMLRTAWSGPGPGPESLARVASRLLELGPAIIGLKLGDDGLYLRTASAARIAAAGRGIRSTGFAGRELLSPNFEVAARGTTGAGDATIAGFLAALAQGLPVDESACMASAVGAFSVEGVDATSGVKSWLSISERLAGGWPRNEARIVAAAGWRRDEASGLMLGPNDEGGAA